jgi:hypothetical protein
MTATVKVATGYLAHEFINKAFEIVATGRATELLGLKD